MGIGLITHKKSPAQQLRQERAALCAGLRWGSCAGAALALGCAVRWAALCAGLRWESCAGPALALGCAGAGLRCCAGLRWSAALGLRWRWAALALACAERCLR